MSILICSTTYGGCGFIGNGQREFTGDDNFVWCTRCGEDYAFQLTEENVDSLTNDGNRDLAKKLLNCDPSVTAIADCGCVYYGEEGEPCEHDIALARIRHGAQLRA